MAEPGPRILVVQHEAACPPAWFGDWLTEAGCTLDVRHPYSGDELPHELPDDLGGHQGLLVLGGAMGAHDEADHPWLAPTKALVREAAATGVPTLGICLGHQLVADALGAEVGLNPRGQQLGLLPVGWTDEGGRDELTAPVVGTGVGVQWNDDVVLRVPEGVAVLATTPEGELQAARFAPTVWGVQLHPEAHDGVLRVWAEDEVERDAEGAYEPMLAEVAAARDQLHDGWRPLALSFAAVVRRAG